MATSTATACASRARSAPGRCLRWPQERASRRGDRRGASWPAPLVRAPATATTRATGRTPIGATWCYSTSTSTATPVGGWARVIRPDGQRSSLGASRTSRTPARASARRPSPPPNQLQEHPVDHAAEWLEADGLGGFASRTVGGGRTRRYHALLLAATTPPTGRYTLVNGCDCWIERQGRRFPLSTQCYSPRGTSPDGERRLKTFSPTPWPTWLFRLEDDTEVEHQLFVPRGSARAILSWKLRTPAPGVRLVVRPFLSGRDYHALHHENPGFQFDARRDGDAVTWRPYDRVPGVLARSNGLYTHDPQWYRGFLYTEERDRGQDFLEDLASPGSFTWDLSGSEALWSLEAESGAEAGARPALPSDIAQLRATERRRREAFPSPLHRAADAYLVGRGAGMTIVAGYPWFTDWGRDTFIALRGLCLAGARLNDARGILLQWADAVSEGMLPNRFPDRGDQPEFNAVDAALWYVVAVHEYFVAVAAADGHVPESEHRTLDQAVQRILTGYATGTRYGIHADRDGLLAAGQPVVQLTWMDAKVGDWVVTPRIGKPVEVQALWLNALRIGSAFSERSAEAYAKGLTAFTARFWDETRNCLHDVVDVGHRRGTVDPTFRPNQIFAVGGLPFAVLDGERARCVVDAVEARLLTPLGLRSLAPDAPGYTPRYEGGVRERDGAYHQGTVWPWLMGPFVEAWIRVRGATAEARGEARARFLDPVLAHLDDAGLGHLPQIADREPPPTPRGCPFPARS